MNELEAIRLRHSVRQYESKPLPKQVLTRLQEEVDRCNAESGLHIQLVTGEQNAFTGLLAHYGSFRGVENYIALVGRPSPDFDRLSGYYGERLVLLAQQLGLNTCWVALTFSKAQTRKHITLNRGEKLGIVISLGYGATQGKPHRSKTAEEVTEGGKDAPEWFHRGVEAALLAPTAMNQQKFLLTCTEGKVRLKALLGPHSKIDQGIVQYHFEVGSGKKDIWL